MFGFMKSTGSKGSKPSPVSMRSHGSPGYNPFDSDSGSRDTSGCNYNPFDSDSEPDIVSSKKQTPVMGRQVPFDTVVFAPVVSNPDRKRSDSPGSEDVENKTPVIGRRIQFENVVLAPDVASSDRKRSDSPGSDDVEHQSVQGLENYALHKAEENTGILKKCLKIGEDIRGDAVRTLEMLHHQGQQITRTHHVAVDIDKDLSRGEKLLGSLGSMFSRTWKPKKGRDITGPLTMADQRLSNSQPKWEQRENLGVTPASKIRSTARTTSPDPANAFQKVQLEKDRQDDALSDLSNVLDDLKGMALEMGSEIERQNKALDHFGGDVDELNFRVKGANQRTRRLLGK
ncbi:unnamed protein product [Rhodiola kirilowii]